MEFNLGFKGLMSW